MSWSVYLPYLLVMAGVTYLVRAVPLTLVRKPIRSPFFRSFLHYVPYAVLAAMTFPDVLFSTGYSLSGTLPAWCAGLTLPAAPLLCAAAGLLVGTVFAWRGKSLLTVAVAACAAVAAAQGCCLLFFS